MTDAYEGGASGGGNTEFFLQFPVQGILYGFADFQFSARKFPKSTEVSVIGAASNEDASIRAVDDADSDVEFGSGVGLNHAGGWCLPFDKLRANGLFDGR